jgi:hypothetical protein
MSADPAISWLFRIVLAILAFCLVWFGLPWLLGLAGISWPVVFILLLSVLAALIVLSHYYWGRRTGVGP